jgi:hypothetical protein
MGKNIVIPERHSGGCSDSMSILPNLSAETNNQAIIEMAAEQFAELFIECYEFKKNLQKKRSSPKKRLCRTHTE